MTNALLGNIYFKMEENFFIVEFFKQYLNKLRLDSMSMQ